MVTHNILTVRLIHANLSYLYAVTLFCFCSQIQLLSVQIRLQWQYKRLTLPNFFFERILKNCDKSSQVYMIFAHTFEVISEETEKSENFVISKRIRKSCGITSNFFKHHKICCNGGEERFLSPESINSPFIFVDSARFFLGRSVYPGNNLRFYKCWENVYRFFL